MGNAKRRGTYEERKSNPNVLKFDDKLNCSLNHVEEFKRSLPKQETRYRAIYNLAGKLNVFDTDNRGELYQYGVDNKIVHYRIYTIPGKEFAKV